MITDIWTSFRSLPTWVQVWVALILVPVNMVPLGFLDQPNGVLIAVLAITGMALNLPIMLIERGFGKTMALPHLLCWTPLVVIIVMTLLGAKPLPSGYVTFLMVLLVVDVISLAFDVNDAAQWFRDRKAK